MAKAVSVDERTLRRKLKSVIGQTPAACLRAFRLREAARRLRQTDQPVGTIALECGFRSHAGFSRQFRAAFGCSPADWRTLR